MTKEEIFDTIEQNYEYTERLWRRCKELLYLIDLKRTNPLKYWFCSMFNGSRGCEEEFLAAYEAAMMGIYTGNEGFIRDVYPEINVKVWTTY